MPDQALREHLLRLLDWQDAHANWESALADWPESTRGTKPPGAPHSPWQLLEHLRLCQWDILEFSRDPSHVSPKFPEGYWPKGEAPPSSEAWVRSLDQFRRDLEETKKLLADSGTELFAKIPHGEGQTILREILLIADHNAYHMGQLVLLRRLVDCWPTE